MPLRKDSISIAGGTDSPAASFNQGLSEILPATGRGLRRSCAGGLQIDPFRLGPMPRQVVN